MHHLVARRVWPLVVWTLLVWVPRLRNIWIDDDLSTTGQLGRTALAASLIVPAVIVAATLWRRRGERLVGRARAEVIGLAGWTVAVWVIRGGSILFADHDLGFKVVHTMLAVVSIGLAGLAVRAGSTRSVGHSSLTSR